MSASTFEKPAENAEEANSTNEAAAQAPNEGTEGSSEYIAPFYPYHGIPRRPNRYMVTLKKSHTTEKHCEVIGERIRASDTGGWYSATLSNELRERVRRDPGVVEVTQYGTAEWG